MIWETRQKLVTWQERYDIINFASKQRKKVVPPGREGIHMTVLEVLALLNLICAIVFGILGYIKK